MRRVRASAVVALGVLGAVIGFLLEVVLAASSLPVLIPPPTLPITLVVVAGIVLIWAIPIGRAIRGTAKTKINPFQAMRVAVLAQACSLAGALATGVALGILLYLLTRSVLPATNAIVLAVAATVGGAILLAAGLVAQHLCTLPPGNDHDKEHAPAVQ